MPLIIDRFEDNDIAVLEAEDGEFIDVPRPQIPFDAQEGDVLVELPENELSSEVRYKVDYELTEQRLDEAEKLRASLPKAEDGDIELCAPSKAGERDV